MRAWKYKRLTPKVIVAQHKLIDTKDIVDLVGRSLDYVHSWLAKTPYQVEISEIPDNQLSATSIQNALLKNYIRTSGEIMDYSPKDIGFLLSTMMMKFEADNVKAMLRARWAGIGVDEAMRFITPAGKMDERRCRSVLENSESVRDVIELLSDVEYVTSLKDALRDYENTGALLPLEAALNRHVYAEIHKAAGKLKGRDRKIAKTVLGLEIDSMNLRVIFRGKILGLDEDQIVRYLLPTSEILGEKEWETAIRAIDTKSAIESLLAIARYEAVRDYQYMLTALLKEYVATQSLSRLEMVLDRSLLKTSLRMLKRYTPYFNIGLILAFLTAKWFEVRNLRVIVRGAEDDTPPDKTTELLILPD